MVWDFVFPISVLRSVMMADGDMVVLSLFVICFEYEN
jgi:hypothetical protein